MARILMNHFGEFFAVARGSEVFISVATAQRFTDGSPKPGCDETFLHFSSEFFSPNFSLNFFRIFLHFSLAEN